MPAQDRSTLLQGALTERILVFDGAMGTAIQSYGLTEDDYRGRRFASWERPLAGANDLLSLTQPEIVREIHASYLRAGADIIETNTFNATSVALEDYGLEGSVLEINREAARLARSAADDAERADPSRPRWVAGAMGPTNRTASISPDVADPGARSITFDELAAAYAEQARGLIAGGADLLLVETAFDTLNAKAALFALSGLLGELGSDVPVAVSGTIADLSGRTLSGQTPEAFHHSVAHGVQPGPGRASGLLAIGFNCALGITELLPHMRALASVAAVPTLCYPNAGLPDELGEYNDGPEHMASLFAAMAGEGLVNLVGGCCGTTPEHIRAIREAVAELAPRRTPGLPRRTRLSGLEPLVVEPGGAFFVNVGERTNVTGSRKFARLVREGSPEAIEVARDQVAGGAQVIDVNMDDALLDASAEMTRFLNVISAEPDVARVPVMVDSSEWEVIESGLKCLQGKGIINSLSLKDGEEAFRSRVRSALRYGAAIVVMAFDEQGQADTVERRVGICRRAHSILVDEGFPPEDVIFDPNVFAVATGIAEHDRYALDFFEATRRVKAACPHVLVSGGISNVSFSFRGSPLLREAMHAAFLRHAIEAGLDMAIINAGALPVYDDLPDELLEPIEDVLLARDASATERLVELAQDLRGSSPKNDGAAPQWRSLPLDERLVHALVHGIDAFIETDVESARKELGGALAVIEGPLMAGMDRVGDLFGAGRIFLPQVVKSARVMKKGVERLVPYLEAERARRREAGETGLAFGRKGKILLATVKGDVHDIGKNILAVVLRCNGYEVVDLGVMVPGELILETAERERVDAIGLSGLITPSLAHMARIADEMERRGFSIPLLIGGATTSKVHTALRIEPGYAAGPTVYVPDASRAVGVCGSLFDRRRRNGYIDRVRSEYDALRTRRALADRASKRDSERDSERASRRDSERWPNASGIEGRSDGSITEVAPAPARGTAARVGSGRASRLLTIGQARSRALKLDWNSYRPPTPALPGVHSMAPSIAELRPFVDWGPFFAVWEMRGRYPQILDDPGLGPAARALHEEAQGVLDELESDGRVRPRGVAGLFPARGVEDDILVRVPAPRTGERGEWLRVPFLRQQFSKGERPAMCLADFVAPSDSGSEDWLGAFAVSAGRGIDAVASEAESEGDDFRSILVKALGDRLAEAFAEYLHARVRTELWGYAAGENLSERELVAEAYRGIRPAPGYPACPDHAQKRTIFDLLGADALEMELTESCAMLPASSVSGWYFAHPQARYFGVGRVGRDQVEDYAGRLKWSVEEAEEWLAPNLGYDPEANAEEWLASNPGNDSEATGEGVDARGLP